MPLQPRSVLVHCQWRGIAPSFRPPHQPFLCRRARAPKRAHICSASWPLLHRRRGVVRLGRRRMHVANIGAECGPHPGLPRKGQCIWFGNPSAQGRPLPRRWPRVRRSPQIRTWERPLPRLSAFPAIDHQRRCGLEPPWNTPGRETPQKPRQHVRATRDRRTCRCCPRLETDQALRRSGGRGCNPVCTR